METTIFRGYVSFREGGDFTTQLYLGITVSISWYFNKNPDIMECHKGFDHYSCDGSFELSPVGESPISTSRHQMLKPGTCPK